MTTGRPAAAPAPPAQSLVATFGGALPCADCAGIRTVLSLYAIPGADPTSGTYTLQFTYEGRGVTRDEAGRWAMVHGTPVDPRASVYQLTDAVSSRVQFWLKVSDTELRELGEGRKELDMPAAVNHSLTRTARGAEPPPGAYRLVVGGATDPAVKAATTFAMDQQRVGSPGIELVSVIRAESQIVAGTNYRLCLAVRRDGKSDLVLAVVFRDLKNAMILASWTPGGC